MALSRIPAIPIRCCKPMAVKVTGRYGKRGKKIGKDGRQKFP
jgi:hypothetical protein